MPYTTSGLFQPVMWGQRMLHVYEMYSISEKNSAVTSLINTTTSVKQEVSLQSNKNLLSLKQRGIHSLPFLTPQSELAEI